ncbi:YcaO-like family protein [Bradyrhizobium sp. CB3481]|uniref:YcaO-like family protein n=1 Tax=Bradyrhizobium sp. CB3481 TaxID=3039158 RepID=UPI0024B23FD9|nr:YcaO-like family protein [Bradyrhizobium sp. CB3481]WFU16563.1 YcaO-like family protein [Bradyrhizobium sp. CB3481]
MVQMQARPAFLEVDLTSAQGAALLSSVSEKYGPKIVEAASLAARMFLLRSPWAPGLRFTGAETKRAFGGEWSTEVSFSLSGSGETLEDAFVSCIGEGIDRLAQIECPGDIAAFGRLAEIADRALPTAIVALGQDMTQQALPVTTPLAWVSGKLFDTNFNADRGGGRDVLLPADWCLRRAPGQQRLRPRTALSVGVAAGPTFDWAASRALLELIERDAASLWWIGGRRGRDVPLDHPATTEIRQLIGTLRQDSRDRTSWVLDLTTDIGIPVIAALSCDADGKLLAYGLAARLSLEDAARAAILELCQTELAILLAQIRQAENGEDNLPPEDRAHLERGAAIKADQCTLLHALGCHLTPPADVVGPALPAIASAMARCGIEAALIDMTRPQFGIPVVRAVAPALQLMPSNTVTDRMRHAFEDWGGGSRYTGGTPLIS